MKINTMPVVVGIIGGGQLAQMLALASRQVGVRPVIFAQKSTDCALEVTQDFVLDEGDDLSLENFLNRVDLVTIENEFLDLDRFERVLGEKFKDKIFPSIATLRLIQSKLDQKKFLEKNKIPTLDFLSVQSPNDFKNAYDHFKGNLVLKKATLAYDGRGTFITKGPIQFEKLLENYGRDFLGYAEPLSDFKKELAVVVARSSRGEIKAYSTFETYQENGICQWAINPAGISSKQNQVAQGIAKKVIQKVRGVGVFTIEMFLLKNGEIVINEIAPRVHNSGHLTQNACLTSQFEQHLRAILGLPLGSTELKQPSAMVNIIGVKECNLTHGEAIKVINPMVEKDLWLHWYGKTGFTQNRKLGHINTVGKSVKESLKRAQKARKKILI